MISLVHAILDTLTVWVLKVAFLVAMFKACGNVFFDQIKFFVLK